MQQVDSISLVFEDNGRLHADLVLRIGNDQWRCDSYYLWCEDPTPGGDHVPVVRTALDKLLAQWIAAVSRLRLGELCFLPFDFSDQFTRWLRCTAEGADILVERGWSEVEGWSFAPSDVGELMASVPGFRAEGTPVRISRAKLLASLGGSPAAE